MLQEVFHESFEIFEITRICMENHASMTVWQSCFSHTNASTFRPSLQSPLLRMIQLKLEAIQWSSRNYEYRLDIIKSLSITFTSSGKREFVPHDQLSFSFGCRQLFIISAHKLVVSRNFCP